MANSAGSQVGAPSSDTLLGPPDRMIPAGWRARIVVRRRVRRPDLRVDRKLAQTTGDQLRVLGPEIEHDECLVSHWGEKD